MLSSNSIWIKLLILVVALRGLVMQNTSNINCGNDWKAFGSYCYKVYTEFEYYETARTICKNKGGGDLVTIKSESENKFINSIVSEHSLNKEAWIGLKKNSGDFIWSEGESLAQSKYSNWFINRPNDKGNCCQMIPGGQWVNILCYNQMQFVCKKMPEVKTDNKRLYTILQVSIPLSCIFIMFFFVAILCWKSYKELEEIRSHTKEGNPFHIVQAAMELPTMQKTPDLFQRKKGVNLWQGAIERIKQEQNAESLDTDLKSSNGSNGGGFSVLVQSVMKNNRDNRERVLPGTLGAPAIFVTKNSFDDLGDKTGSKLETDTTVDKTFLDVNSEASTEYFKEESNDSNSEKSKINEGFDDDDDTANTKVFKSEVGVWLKGVSRSRQRTLSIERKRAFVEAGKTQAIDIDIDENDNHTKCANLVEVIVDVNHRVKGTRNINNRLNNTQQIFNIHSPEDYTQMSPPPAFLQEEYTRSDKLRESIKQKRNNKEEISKDTIDEQNDSNKQFPYHSQQESYQKKDEYSSKMDHNENYENITTREKPATHYKKLNKEYFKVTFV